MSRLFIDGFENGGTTLWTATVGTPTIVSSTGKDMSGTYVLDLTETGDGIKKTLSATLTEVYVAFKYRANASDSFSQSLCTFWDSAGTVALIVRKNSTTKLIELRFTSATGTLLATGSTPITSATTFLIEVYYKPSNTAGTITVKVDGVQDVTYGGGAADTTSGLDANVRSVGFGYWGSVNSCCCIDDVVIDSASWVGVTYIQGIFATGAGTNTGWTASTGSNYDCVDEVPKDDTDYIYTNTTGVYDTYTMSDLVGSIGTIKCLQVEARMAFDGTPTPTQQDLVVRSGGTNYPSGTAIAPALTYGSHSYIWETNPADGAAWDGADVNAVECGVKSVA